MRSVVKLRIRVRSSMGNASMAEGGRRGDWLVDLCVGLSLNALKRFGSFMVIRLALQ